MVLMCPCPYPYEYFTSKEWCEIMKENPHKININIIPQGLSQLLNKSVKKFVFGDDISMDTSGLGKDKLVTGVFNELYNLPTVAP
nr:10371_t:CDS:2 [Entrophospora candida]